MIPILRFPSADHFAFFFEDSHLMMIIFPRDNRHLLFLLREGSDDVMELDFPGDLFESRVRDAVDRIFLVTLQQQAGESIRLALGAYFIVEGAVYGAYYDRDTSEETLFFLHVLGDGDTATLEAVEETQEYQVVSASFMERYENLLNFNTDLS